MVRKTGIALAVVSVLAMSLAACGGDDSGDDGGGSGMTAAEVYKKFGQMSPDERDPLLLEIAKKEGTIEHYSAWTYGEDQGKAFTEKYGIPVNVYSTDNDTVYQKIQQEHDAGRDNADVVDMGYLNMTILDQEGVFAQGWSHGRDTEPIGPGVFPSRLVAFVVAWNTDEISDDEAPKTYEDLADPKYKGKISFEMGDFDWFYSLHKYYTETKGMSEDDFTDMWEKIIANGHAAKGHTAMVTSLASGEDVIAADVYSQNVEALAAEGAPVAWETQAGTAVEPIVVNPSGVGILTDSEHPAGAMLFADWLTSPEGQQVYLDHDAMPADQSVTNFPQQYEQIGVPAEELVGNTEAQSTYDALMRMAGGGQ